MNLDPKVLKDLYGDQESMANPFPEARKYNPQDVAKGVGIQQKTGVDAILAAQRLPEFQDELDQNYWNKLVTDSPRTAKFLAASPVNAALLQPDADSGVLTQIAAAAKWMVSAPGAKRGLLSDVADSATLVGVGGLAGVGKMIFDVAGAGADLLGAATGSDQLRNVGASYRATGTRAGEAISDLIPKEGWWNSSTGKAIGSGLTSAGTNLLMLPIGIERAAAGAVSSGANMVAGLMGLGVGADAYSEARNKGKDALGSLLYAVPQGAFEYAFEKIPAGKLFEDLAAGKTTVQSMIGQLVPELWTEQLTTVAQDFNAWMNLNPEKTAADFIAERPGAAYQTLVATLIGVGLQSGAARVISKTFGSEEAMQQHAQQAEQHATFLDGMQKTMQASEILKTDPATLTAYMQELSDEGVPTIFVDSAKLVEAGIDLQALAQVMPSVAAQLDQVQTGGDLAIPTGELLTSTIGTEFAQSLIDNARTDVNGMSRVEAKEYMAEKGDKINAEIERVLAERQDDATFKAGRDEVQAQILQQLNDIQRFTPKVNEQYAALASNFYAVMAARTGMTVQDFAARYKLGFDANTAHGQVDYDQTLEGQFTPTEQAMSRWKQSLERTPSGDSTAAAKLQTPTVLRAMGIKESHLQMSVSMIKQVMGKHPDVPLSVFENLPALMADPLYAYPHKDGGTNVLISATTAAGEPIIVGVRDGRIRTITPNNDDAANSGSGFRRAMQNFESAAAGKGGKVYARNEEGPVKTGPSAEGGYRTIPVDHGPKRNATVITRAALVKRNGEDFYQPAYHGTPHDFDKFSTDHMGSGEGAQAYGWGLYFAENKGIAESYQRTLSNDSAHQRYTVDGKELGPKSPEKHAASLLYHNNATEIKARAKAWLEEARKGDLGMADTAKNAGLSADEYWSRLNDFVQTHKRKDISVEKGRLYQVDIPDEHVANFLNWDKPLSEQSESVRKTLGVTVRDHGAEERLFAEAKEKGIPVSEMPGYAELEKQMDAAAPFARETGAEAYRALSEKYGGDAAASKFLDSIGIKGIKFLDATSRNMDNVKSDIDMSERAIQRETDKIAALQEEIDLNTGRGSLLPQFFKRREEDIAASKKLIVGYKKKLEALNKELANPTHNLVVIDDSIIKVTHKDGTPVTPAERAEYFQPAYSKGAAPSAPAARAQIAFANDITQQASIISLLKNADLSSFIHESGHFFLEVQADLARRITERMAQGEQVSDGEQSILADFNTTLKWMGVAGDEDASAIDQWAMMSADEKRPHHEQFARGFEAYAFEGKAPSMELQSVFQTFRAWLVNVYRTVKDKLIGDTLNVELNDEVRAVMDRMLATTDAIEEAEAARSMGPLFKTPEEGGMDLEAYKLYHDMGTQATQDAIQELQGKGLRDMQWLQNARSRKLKEMQKKHDAMRALIAREVKAEVMSQPIYQAWTFLTSKQTEKVVGEKPVGNSKGLNPEVDNLFVAIAKLGGLDRAEVKRLWGIDEKEKLDSGVFGSPVVRKEGGLSTDAMAERLMEAGYLLPDENGKADHDKFEELFDDQRRGTDRYSIQRDMAAAYGDAPLNVPELPEVGFGKLRTEELRRRYGVADDAVWRKLSALRMTSDDGGLDPDVVAELFGFGSGDELVKTLAETEPPKSVIEGMTDQRMLEQHGDLATPAGLERAADAAIHNDARVRFVATELRALQHAMSVREKVPGQKNTVDVLARAAREHATTLISRLKVRDIRPSQYAAAEVRAARAAEKARGDLAKQTEAKRNQLINLWATKAAYTAQDEVKAAVLYFKKFDKDSKALDPEYQAQIDALLERFDLKVSTSLKTIDKRKSLVEWLESQAELGLEPSIPEDLLQEANRKSFKDMTVEEIRGLRDTIKQIEHIGRLKNRLVKARDKREFDLVATEMAGSIVANGGEARPLELEGPNPVVDWFAGVWAQHRKLGSLFRQMDGSSDAGPMYETIGRGMNESATAEDVMNEKATKELQALYAPLLKLRGGISSYRSKVFIKEINASLTRGGRLAVALNWGNEANRQRIMDGDGWSAAQVDAILKTLTPAELDFVNKVWEYLDSYWPEVAAKEKRLTGIEPEKVESAPFVATASDGTKVSMRGGYYPIKYDSNRSDRTAQQDAAQAAKEMIQGAFTRATTRRGHTKARVDAVNRAVRKDLNVITQHVSQVVHDLAWHEWLIDTNRLLSDKRVSGAIRDHYGPQVLKTMRDGIMGIATADVVPQTNIDQALLLLRSNVTRATMGASLTTAFLPALWPDTVDGPHWSQTCAAWGGPWGRGCDANGKHDGMGSRQVRVHAPAR